MQSDNGLRIKAFGEFTVELDGKPLDTISAGSKELLAYLVDANGRWRSYEEIAAAMHPGMDEEQAHRRVRSAWRELRAALTTAGYGDCLHAYRGQLRIDLPHQCCDYYTLLANRGNVRSYAEDFKGAYMEQYGWAAHTRHKLHHWLAYRSI